MSLSPTVEKTIAIKDKDGQKLCDVTYPSNSFTDSETMDIWQGRMYPPLRLKEEPKVFVDIGACWGDSTLFFATLYKTAYCPVFHRHIARWTDKIVLLQPMRAQIGRIVGEAEIGPVEVGGIDAARHDLSYRDRGVHLLRTADQVARCRGQLQHGSGAVG